MSHFLVGVFVEDNGKSLNELLDPYCEYVGEERQKYAKFKACTNEQKEKYKEYKKEYSSLDSFMKEYYNFSKNKETGEYGYWVNLQGKWDYYSVGGRWNKLLITKEGKECNSARLKDIDWKKMKNLRREDLESTWDLNLSAFEKALYGILEKDTKTTYIERNLNFTTFAVITPNGEWHAKGESLGFGVSTISNKKWDEEYFKNFIENSDKENKLYIVDCHT